MRTTEINFKIPEDTLNVLNQNRDGFTHQARLFIGLQLFKTHKLSFGKAADLAGIS